MCKQLQRVRRHSASSPELMFFSNGPKELTCHSWWRLIGWLGESRENATSGEVGFANRS